MNTGEELLKAWTICAKFCEELERLLNDLQSALEIIDNTWAKKYNKTNNLKSCFWRDLPEARSYTRFGLPGRLIQAYKLKDDPNSHVFLWYSVTFLFDEKLAVKIDGLPAKPLIFAAKISVTRGYQESYQKSYTLRDIAEDFDFFDEEWIGYFKKQEFPKADSEKYFWEYLEKGDKDSKLKGNSIIAELIGYPLMRINNANDIMTKLIKPLFP